jgi:acetyl esterase/lipase
MRLFLSILLLSSASWAAGLQSDIEYGKAADVSLKMDAWIPEGKGPFPAVILAHGGGWNHGDKADNFRWVFEPLSKAGFAWFSVNYRLAPKYLYPAAIDDVLLSVKYVEANAARYNVDPKRIALSGESAGGHIVAYIAARYGRDLKIAAVVPFYPATDFDALVEGQDKTDLAYRGVLQFIGAKQPDDHARKVMAEASPVTWVRAGMPPFLFIHGTKDQLCNFRQSQEMCAKMKQAGSKCEIYAVEGAPHWIGNWEKEGETHPEWMGYKQKLPEWLKQAMK